MFVDLSYRVHMPLLVTGFSWLLLASYVMMQNIDTNCGFQCKSSKECIDEDAECNGVIDCKDGSDETEDCQRIKCPNFLFRCTYGACINANLECDNKTDCADNSDETSLKCSQSNELCRADEFKCLNGQCIDEDGKCNGVIDCSDGTDESWTTCSKIRCPGFLFRCKYGACIEQQSRCDNKRDCADGSDEENCASTVTSITPPTPAPNQGSICLLPRHPINGQWSLWVNGEKTVDGVYSPGSSVQNGALLQFQCRKDFKLNGEKFIICMDGAWNGIFPNCEILCPALVSTKTTTVQCTYRGIPEKDCSEPRSGTVARFSCAPFYEDLQLLRVPQRICKDGSWDLEKPNCVPACGRKSTNAQTLIVGGNQSAPGDYPWQIALYRQNGASIKFICGGSLISQRVILTAAHCVTDIKGKPYPSNQYVISAGKYYQGFNDSRDTDAQYSQVQEIYVPDQYGGETQNFLGDLSLLVAVRPFRLDKRVLPICVDWGQNFEQQLTQSTGIVTGWGLTTPTGNGSDELKYLEVPYIQYSQCVEELPSDFENYLTYDKFCSGYLNKGIGVCKGDSGGALVSKNRLDSRYYVTGVVSVSPFAEGSCDIEQYALYTKVSVYIPFMFPIERLYVT